MVTINVSFVGNFKLAVFCHVSSAVADRVPEGAVTVAKCRGHVTQDELAAGVDDAVDLISAVTPLAVRADDISAAVTELRCHCRRGQKWHSERSQDYGQGPGKPGGEESEFGGVAAAG